MTTTTTHRSKLGPWLVALGAALWGTESAWRKPLNDLFEADVIVFWEHAIQVVLFLPLVLARRRELKTASLKALAYLGFSGIAGSAVGTIMFTLALKNGNATVVNVLLDVQPILSTIAGCLLFREALSRKFYPWAAVAVIAGAFLWVQHPSEIPQGFAAAGLDAGAGYAFLCALFWGLATVAGRGVMLELTVWFAAGMRVVVGLAATTVILALLGHLNVASLWPAAAAAQPARAIVWMLLLATFSGGLPLLIYFKGLQLTEASTAGYFEMMQTVAAVGITWGVMGESLSLVQTVAAAVLIVAVAFIQWAQQARPIDNSRLVRASR